MHKQYTWMKHLGEQVLEANIAKARYQVRLDSAEKRTKSLGQELSKAYAEMTRLLKKRLEIEGTTAHNDALVAYLNYIGNQDRRNAEGFVENKATLDSLQSIFKNSHACRRKYDLVIENVYNKERLSTEVLEHTESLMILNEQLHKLWTAVPPSVKLAVFQKSQR